MSTDLRLLKASWQQAWPQALLCWSRFVQLSEPQWCLTEADEKREQLSGSFAMIRLVDHAVVISLRQVAAQGLGPFAKEVLAHEIGHHVYCPADLTDNARLLARTRAGLPTKERLAGFISNLYTDLLINDRLQRSAELNIAGVYLQLGRTCQDKLWTLYMRTYELLWKLERGALAKGEIDARLNHDASLAARLIRSYAREWLDGAGRFAALCLPYLLEDEAKKTQKCLGPWLDTQCAGAGGMPDGLAEIDEGEQEGAIHPSEDPDISGVGPDEEPAAETLKDAVAKHSKARARHTGRKTIKRYREPFEYAEVLRATGLEVDERELTIRYYRERALPHLVPFPTRPMPQATDPMPEGLDTWDIGAPLEEIDWLGTIVASPHVIPGVTTRRRLVGTSPGTTPETAAIDLYLGVDCSGSMSNPAHRLSWPVLAGAVIALSALRVGSRVMVALSGEPGQTITTGGFVQDERAVLGTLTGYLGTGYSFGIHRLADTFDGRPPTARPAHILIVSDNDIFSILDQRVEKRLGWDVARESLAKAKGGGTYVLELPAYLLDSASGKDHTSNGCQRMRTDGWTVSPVGSMDQLLEFARQFSRLKYGPREPAMRNPITSP